jgi:hypothetical protein
VRDKRLAYEATRRRPRKCSSTAGCGDELDPKNLTCAADGAGELMSHA